MYKSTRLLSASIGLILAFSGGVFYSPQTWAQEEAGDELEEVIVSASRRDEKLQDVAVAVTVVNVDDFTKAGMSSLADILPFVPGVSVDGNGQSFFNQVFIRGVNAVLSAGVVSYVDDIPFGSSTVYTSPAPLDGTLLDLGTLDVLKGPQGTLYGASAMGGMLQFNTRDASLTDWTGSISADLSDTHRGGFNQLYRVNANGPIVTDTLGMSFTAFWKDKSGYIDNVAIPKNGWDDSQYYGGSGSLRWAATDKLEFKLQGLYQKSTQDAASTVQANYADDEFFPGVAAGEPWYGKYKTGETETNPSEYKASMLGLTIDYSFDFGKLTSVTSDQKMTYVESPDLTIPYAYYADIYFPDNAPHTSALLVKDLGFDKFTQEVRLTSNSNQSFEWIVGGYYTKEDGHNIQNLITTPAEPFLYANFPSTYKETSFFANGTYYFRPDFDASAGIRYADYSNDVKLDAVGPLLAPIPLTSIDDKVTTYLFNMRYRPSDTMSLYGRIASGYRPGGANFVLLDMDGNPLTNAFFKPDTLWSYEAGMKGSSADGRVGYDFAVFYIDWQDYQISVVRGGVGVAGNADKAVSKGAEAALSFAVTDALTLRATLSYTDAKLAADTPDLGGADGDQLPNSPKWQGGLDLNYDFNVGNLPAYAGVAWTYKGKMPVGFNGYTDASGMYWPPSAPRVEVGSYNLVDLRAGINVGKVDLSFYLTNLFDEWAYTSFTSSYAIPSLGVPTRPRTLGVVARWNFF